MTKTRYSKEGCKITTVVRKHPSFGVTEEIILQAEGLHDKITTLEFEEEDTGSWLIGDM